MDDGDDDDLPPKGREPQQSLGGALGFVFSQAVWIGIFLVIAGLILVGVMHLY